MPVFDGRFTSLKVVNCDLAAGDKRGCFSIVFRAHDLVDGKDVALKFFDLEPAVAANVYRRMAFDREDAILRTLLTRDRCLQLAKSLSVYSLSLALPAGGAVSVPCSYFAVEWLDEPIDEYFLDRQPYTAANRLRLFRDILLAVEALHRQEVFHRDLKADNFRAVQTALKRVVVAIDLGCAARLDSGAVATSYGCSVGAPAYAAPEAICGLAGNRRVAAFTDHYALGCLLFEMFNKDLFFRVVQSMNPALSARLTAIAHSISPVGDDWTQITQLNTALDRFANGVAPVPMDMPGHTCDPAVVPLLSEALRALTNFDYRRRPRPLGWARGRIDIAIRVLDNESEYQKRLRNARELRRRRIQRAKDLEARIAARNRTRLLPC
jgi:serine/threonine protein kinase